ncbi:transcriptional regulator [Ligilactobacillus salitolerans]|uniref:Transcriptional regulator n=1 Tax=Ligilactobacillus salitolerans TaxID=1808352 RepID=A0A401IPV9_9LACO|nr:helix-turn-helix domain-containing protein [Ligilactobacillus salitolerans]GBG93555.1 transcriptional regulator [Ligilactobacillus salitolerans]
MPRQLGNLLKSIRKQQRLSQKEVAAGICAQSMLSAIENGKYMPNARLLLALCDRLAISLDEISLSRDFSISTSQMFNNTLSKLCDQHKYAELKNFLLDPATIDKVQTAEQTQAYYYYLGVANFHVDTDLTTAEQNLKISISSDEKVRIDSALTRLGLVSLGFIQAKKGLADSASTLTIKAMTDIDQANYTQNLNIIFYLAALTNYKLRKTKDALKWTAKGIAYITDHDPHYMLANLYRLIAQIAEENEQEDRKLEALQRSDFLKSLFKEKINENF